MNYIMIDSPMRRSTVTRMETRAASHNQESSIIITINQAMKINISKEQQIIQIRSITKTKER